MANVVVSGASRGIGLELVRRHADRGDRVFAFVRNPVSAAELNELAANSGGAVSVHQMDAGDVTTIPERAHQAIGDQSVDLLYNVAGVSGPMNNELETDIDWEAWDEAFDVMVKGPLAVFKAFLPNMREGTRVINFSSQLAASTWPYGGYYVYGATKSGLNRIMRSVAIDVKDRGIVVITLHPGWVQTDMGGPNAEISTNESVDGITSLADRLTIEDSGGFFKWNGEEHAW